MTLRILVPVDYSQSSLEALSYAAMLAARLNGETAVLHEKTVELSPIPVVVVPDARARARGLRTAAS